MKTNQITQKTFIIAALMICFNCAANGQNTMPEGFVAKSDTIYFLDGRIIATNIIAIENVDYIRYAKWNNSTNSFEDIRNVSHSDIHYLFINNNNEYRLVTENSTENDFERLRYNMLRYQEASKKGMLTLSSGVGLVLIGVMVGERQQSKFQESFDPDDINDLPKYLKYAGYGAMFVGGMIKIGSYKFLERGSIDITPVGVRVNF